MSEFDTQITTHPLGYREATPTPSAASLANYYSAKYFQEVKQGGDLPVWRRERIQQRCALKFHCLSKYLRFADDPEPSMLDIGCGPGWSLDFFQSRGWSVRGLDFGSHPMESLNPARLPSLQVGPILDSLNDLAERGEAFHVIWMDNSLEHAADPLEILRLARAIVRPGGVLVVQVPHDFSPWQEYLLERKLVNDPYWICLPDHLNYFNRESLIRIGKETNWRSQRLLADIPVELALANPETHYVNDPARGTGAHCQRLELEGFLFRRSWDEVADLYEKFADVGLGRQLIAFFTPA